MRKFGVTASEPMRRKAQVPSKRKRRIRPDHQNPELTEVTTGPINGLQPPRLRFKPPQRPAS